MSEPVAVNCCCNPAATEAVGGFTVIETRAAGVTVADVVPLIEPDAAVIVAVPKALEVSRPVVEIVAMPVADDVHVTLLSACVDLSVSVPVAVNC